MNGHGKCGIKIQWNITQPEKNNETIPSAAAWLDLEMMRLSQVSQRQKDKFHIISFISGI